ncbi:MAG: GDP-fucose synthetase [Alphaproteobacteria bacterium PA1]|nr:MAG: GDP-fucose synthetase [Alphaproteobacteria bacterium PA1]
MQAQPFDLTKKKIFVAGHRGMVGAAIVRRLSGEDCTVLTASRAELDLRSQADVRAWMQANAPDVVILAAAKVGGIFANDTYPADFLYENLAIEVAVIQAAYEANVQKLVFLGSSCIYPKFAEQPISEDSLLTGPLEPTNQWYAIAKIAGLKMCEAYRKQYGVDYISVMPTNLYGPGDNYDLQNSHVVPALIRKAHDAKLADAASMSIWGEGKVFREFLHVDDMADACVYLLQHYSGDQHVNVGSGTDITIYELAKLIADVVGFKGSIATEPNKPEGTPRKLMDSSRLFAMGWKPHYDLRAGLEQAYASYLQQVDQGVARLSVP